MGIMVLQTFLLLLIAFLVGCAIGCVLRRVMGQGADTGTRGSPPETVAAAEVPSAAQAEAAVETLAAPVMTAAAPAKAAKSRAAKPKAAKAPAARKTAAKPAAKPKAAKPKAAPAKAAAPDDLKKIKGIGKLNEQRLNKEGVTRYAQIAAWKKADVARFDELLTFHGRIEREDWVGQAKKLAKPSR
ncbi:MAG: hypothetical protein AB7L41_16870 [Flavobacteriaceae bacterium]